MRNKPTRDYANAAEIRLEKKLKLISDEEHYIDF